MNKIKIGYFADGPWSHMAFEKIIKDPSIEIQFIVPRSDTTDDTLKNYSLKYKIDYLYPSKINSLEFIEIVKKYKSDLFVSLSFNQIFKKEIIDIPRLGVINCHAGKLPFYRGRNVLNWALINDESEFGITVHFVDEGIDTGDIINQQTFKIDDNDNYQTLLNRAFVGCANILYETLQLILNNNFKRTPQTKIHNLGFYCGGRAIGDELINWNQTSRELFNFIRAICIPGPSAQTYLNDNLIKINASRIFNDSPSYIGIPGQVLTKTKEGFLVKTKDSFIEILEIKSECKIKVGDRFNVNKL